MTRDRARTRYLPSSSTSSLDIGKPSVVPLIKSMFSTKHYERHSSSAKHAPADILLLCIRKRQWDMVHEKVTFRPWEVRGRMKSGSRATALHLALMHRAPMDLISMMVEAYPTALFVQDTEGWTPLHISILYGGEEDTTLLLIHRGAYAASLHSEFVGSPLHLACRHGSSARVIRELIKAYPDQVRLPNDAGSTPACLLWKTYTRHNSDSDDESDVTLLLEHLHTMIEASLHHSRKREKPSLHEVIEFQNSFAEGTNFFALALQRDPDAAGIWYNGRLPIHAAASCSFCSCRRNKRSFDTQWCPELCSCPSHQDPLHLLLKELPEAAGQVEGSSGRLPLHIALIPGRRAWRTGVKHLVSAFPASLCHKDPTTALYPFQLAAAAASTCSDPSDDNNRREVETIFQLLLACPQLVRADSSDEMKL